MRIISILIICIIFISCQEKKQVLFDSSIIPSLINSEKEYIDYSKGRLGFNRSATFQDELGKEITRKSFFESIYRKSFFPLKASNANIYKAVKVQYWPNPDIYAWVSGEGLRQFKRENLIGKTLFKKPLTDIRDNVIDSNYIKGKHVFVKCWFIKCVPCLAEMPQLNKIVKSVNGRDDILFLSLAFDRKDSLVKFLSNREFLYNVIPTYKIPEIDSLGISSFPTHLYVRDNKIQSVISKDEILDLIKEIE